MIRAMVTLTIKSTRICAKPSREVDADDALVVRCADDDDDDDEEEEAATMAAEAEGRGRAWYPWDEGAAHKALVVA